MSSLFDVLKNTSENKTEVFSKYVTSFERKNGVLGEAILQLTPLCNFSCKMCYAKMTVSEICAKQEHVLRFDEWKWYIDRFKEIGTNLISFTGGECMMHPDFEQIYTYAYDSGFRILLMTNGSLLNDSSFKMFSIKPPERFSITVYGGSFETYQRLCRNGNAYDIVYANIDKLCKHGFDVMVKYTVTKDNVDDLPVVYDYFLKRGIRLRYQNSLMQFNKAKKEIVKEVSVEEDKYLKIHNRILKNKIGRDDEDDSLYVNNMKKMIGLSDVGIRCSAGRNICHIRWDGMMTPCVSFENIVLDPRNIGMKTAWKMLNKWAAEYPAMKECDKCVHSSKCLLCASLHYNDTHTPGIPAPRLCWKRNHPEEAARIEKRLVEKGLITLEDIL